MFQHFRTIERDEDGESPVNRERNKEREERREKKLGEHERNTRQRVRKSECHCRNLRTLTSSWLVPPSSSWSQPFSPLPSSVNIYSSSSSSLSLSFSHSLSHLRVSLRILSSTSLQLVFSSLPRCPSLPSSFVFPPREFQMFCDNSRAARYSTDMQSATIELQRSSVDQCNINIAVSICEANCREVIYDYLFTHYFECDIRLSTYKTIDEKQNYFDGNLFPDSFSFFFGSIMYV